MYGQRLKKVLALFLAATLVVQSVTPMVAYAEERSVQVSNHSVANAQAQKVTGITIGNVDEPQPGSTLDKEATVTTTEGLSWEIPVIWVRDDAQLATTAEEGRAYLPVLAFVTPQEYAIEEGIFTVTLSDSLAKLFGTNEVISVYNEDRGITYILPRSLVSLFAQKKSQGATPTPSLQASTADESIPTSQAASDASSTPDVPRAPETPTTETPKRSLIDIYCAQTARKALSDADLEWIVDLIINYLQPQAVELLLNSFPSLRAGAENGEIGTQIGLYVYYLAGDNDIPDHNTPSEALAYVMGREKEVNGELKYCYQLGVNLQDLVKEDEEDGEEVIDPTTGKYILVRSGGPIETLSNTIVHELFHALMDDYNRTGMVGATKLQDIVKDETGDFADPLAAQRYDRLRFPSWFVEGSASTTENVYQFRYGTFQMLRRASDGSGNLYGRFSEELLLHNYQHPASTDAKKTYFDISWSNTGGSEDGTKIETTPARYVTGYLATLYLSDLAMQHVHTDDSALVKGAGNTTTVDTSKLREGLDTILRWLHDGKTLDQIIYDISPVNENKQKVYQNTEDFENKFIKGAPSPNGTNQASSEEDADDEDSEDDDEDDSSESGTYTGDAGSLRFVTTYLNCLLEKDNALPAGEHPNGSILFDFDQYLSTPLEADKKSESDYLKIVESNEAVESSVKSGEAEIGGGMSDPDPESATVKPAAEPVSDQEAEAPDVSEADPEAESQAA